MYQEAKKLTALLLAMPLILAAETIDVTTISIVGPYPTVNPLMTDTLDAEGKRINLNEVYMDESQFKIKDSKFKAAVLDGDFVLHPSKNAVAKGQGSIFMVGFNFQNTSFAKGKVNVKCESRHKLFIDGNEPGGDFEMVPGRHEVSIKLLCKGEKPDTLPISLESEQPIEINPEGKRYWTNADMMHGERINGVELSSTGK